jgi:hypothetical protein
MPRSSASSAACRTEGILSRGNISHGVAAFARADVNCADLDYATRVDHFNGAGRVLQRSRLMLRRILIPLMAVVAVAAFADSSAARQRRPIDATPFAHAPCSVLSGEPCTPSFCSVFNHGPCIPEIDYPIGENLQLTIQSQPAQDDAAKYQKPDHDLGTIGDLFSALRACWSPPPADTAREGMQMSVLFSFKKSGTPIAPPRVTYATPGAPADIRDTYLKAINASLDGCTPLAFTKGLGGAIAGRPIMIRYVDNRTLSRQSGAK